MNCLYEQEFEGLMPHELNELRICWTNLLDFAYSPYEPNLDEIHAYMQLMGKILGDNPPDAMPFSGRISLGEA